MGGKDVPKESSRLTQLALSELACEAKDAPRRMHALSFDPHGAGIICVLCRELVAESLALQLYEVGLATFDDSHGDVLAFLKRRGDGGEGAAP